MCTLHPVRQLQKSSACLYCLNPLQTGELSLINTVECSLCARRQCWCHFEAGSQGNLRDRNMCSRSVRKPASHGLARSLRPRHSGSASGLLCSVPYPHNLPCCCGDPVQLDSVRLVNRHGHTQGPEVLLPLILAIRFTGETPGAHLPEGVISPPS